MTKMYGPTPHLATFPLTLPRAAAWYASRGWPVLPLRPRGKEPMTTHGLLQASIDLDVIEAWWANEPEANIGLRTGVAFDVLDIDGTEGAAALRRLTDRAILHDGPSVATGKGVHLYFAPTGYGNAAALLPKVDFRGASGYVVAPPSLHPDGHKYRWIASPESGLPAAPPWLLTLLARPAAVSVAPAGPHRNPGRARETRPDIFAVAEKRGMTVRRSGNRGVTRCPFHDDGTPSMSLYPETNTFRCFGCEAWGDSWDLAQGRKAA